MADVLPAIYAKRKLNRGFEGLALSPDQKTLFVALQSPLLNPDAATGNPSRIVRILAFDIASEKPTAEYAYVFEPVLEFDTTLERLPTEMKISGPIAAGPDTLIDSGAHGLGREALPRRPEGGHQPARHALGRPGDGAVDRVAGRPAG